jgi:hypothetical protein
MREEYVVDYQLVLSPEIGLSDADFVAAWNVSTECRVVAEAQLVQSSHSRSSAKSSANTIMLKSSTGEMIPAKTIIRLVNMVLKHEGIQDIKITHQETTDGSQVFTAQ